MGRAVETKNFENLIFLVWDCLVAFFSLNNTEHAKKIKNLSGYYLKTLNLPNSEKNSETKQTLFLVFSCFNIY